MTQIKVDQGKLDSMMKNYKDMPLLANFADILNKKIVDKKREGKYFESALIFAGATPVVVCSGLVDYATLPLRAIWHKILDEKNDET
jgi:hypothetical protein